MATRLPAFACAFAVLALALVPGASGCIDARSDEFRCSTTADCDESRSCQDSWCVARIVPEPIASGFNCTSDDSCPEPIDCPSGQPCLVRCTGEDACAGLITCAPGQPCRVWCEGKESCRGGIDCSAATDCQISCNGDKACKDAVIDCGTNGTRCLLECSGKDSCEGDIDCTGSCACDVLCSGDGRNLCKPDPLCPPGCEREQGTGCDSSAPGCNACL